MERGIAAGSAAAQPSLYKGRRFAVEGDDDLDMSAVMHLAQKLESEMIALLEANDP